MESDIRALSARITRLELLLGTQTQRPCIHTATRTTLSKLSQNIPDEIAAAGRAVRLLWLLTSQKWDGVDVGRVVECLQTLDGMEMKTPRVVIDGDDIASVEIRAARLAEVVRKEEEVVDGLLVEFDCVTRRLSHAVMLLAEQVSKRV